MKSPTIVNARSSQPLLLNVLALCFLLFAALAAGAQNNSDLSGEVRDPSHALVRSAKVTVTLDATGVTHQTQTNKSGAYFFSLPPGQYSMDIVAPGFKTIHREDIILHVDQPARLDFTLQVGSVDQTITVDAGTDALQDSFDVSTTITQDELEKLPILNDAGGTYGRNYTNLILLAPGTSDIANLSGADGTISGTNSYSVNGQRSPDNNYTLDGIDNNFLHKQAPGLSPPIDSMKEFRVATNTGAAFGRSAGANVALVTKSGSRELHGSAYEYSRQALFDANAWFNDHNNIPKPPYHYNLFGVNAGGPVIIPKLYNGKLRTFWFFSYEGFRLRESNQIESFVPTAAERTGDFSAVINKQMIYDPLTSHVVNPAKGTIGRTAFPGNIIPMSRLDPAALAYINDFVPLPNIPANSNIILTGTANYINNNPIRNNRNLFVGRIDHHINSRNNVFFRILHQSVDQTTPQALPTFTENQSFSGYNYAAGWDSTPDLKDLIQVRFGFNNPRGPDVTRNTLGINRTQFLAASGIQIFTAYSPYNVIPSINAQDFALGESAGTSVDDIYEANATWTRTLGTSLLRTGFIYQPRHYYHDASSPTSGTATFSVLQTDADGSAITSGSGTASFLLGYPSNIDRGQGSSDVDAVQKFYAAFVDYNRKLGPRLTVDAGLRYEFYLPAIDKQDRLGTLWVHNDPTSHSVTGTLLWAGVNPLPDPNTGAVNDPPNQAGFGRGLEQTNYFNFMPRVGLSYLIGRKSIIRAGYGIYDNTTAFQEVQDERKFYPYNFEQTFGTNAGVLPDTKLENTGPANTGPSATLTLGGYAQVPEKKTPYSQQYNLAIQHQFPATVIAQVSYVGSTNRHLIGYLNFNTRPLPDPNKADAAMAVLNSVNSGRLLPEYGDVYQGANRFRSNYNSLQVIVRKRYRHGFEFQTNYTYSRSLDDQSSLGEFKTQDPFNPAQSYSRSSFDLTHIFNLSFVFDLPFGRGRMIGTHWSHWIDDIAGGWSIESVNRYETGPPVNVTLGGLDEANTGYQGITVQRPNVTGNPNAGPKTVNQWFNKLAFTEPAFGTYGNSRPFTIQSDDIRRTDLSAYKRFITFNNQTLDLRGEFFNLPNTPSFGSPKLNEQAGGSFGTILKTAVAARQVQLALRYTF